jgi:hypothetical protein
LTGAAEEFHGLFNFIVSCYLEGEDINTLEHSLAVD